MKIFLEKTMFYFHAGQHAVVVGQRRRTLLGHVRRNRHRQRRPLPPEGERGPQEADRHPLAHHKHLLAGAMIYRTIFRTKFKESSFRV